MKPHPRPKTPKSMARPTKHFVHYGQPMLRPGQKPKIASGSSRGRRSSTRRIL